MLTALLLLSALAAPQADALAPARAGKIRCVDPDTRARTCATMVRYTVREDGSFDADVDGILADSPLVVLRYRTSGTIEDGAICTVIRPADINAGLLQSENGTVPPAAERELRDRLRLALQPLAGRKRCLHDKEPDADGTFAADVTMAGVVVPEMRQTARWVGADEGYALGD